MQTIHRPLELQRPVWLTGYEDRLPEVLFLDLETTGLSATRSCICLIGCAYLRSAPLLRIADEPDVLFEKNKEVDAKVSGTWHLIQWFDETGEEERDILESFLRFASSFRILVHYNGDRFDLPFLMTRLSVYGLSTPVTRMESLDLYRAVKPYRELLSLPDLRQQTLERCLGTGRTEDRSGGEMVKAYKEYLVSRSPEALADILRHNASDVEGLLAVTSVLSLPQLLSSPLTLYKAQANYYEGYDGEGREELLLYFRMNEVPSAVAMLFTEPLVLSRDGIRCRIQFRGSSAKESSSPAELSGSGSFSSASAVTGLLKVPLYEEEMKYFYADYQNYYYLPAEDQALHKSIASFVAPSRRQNAKAENCYTRKQSSFLPEWDLFREPFFKRDYHDKALFFELSDEVKKSRTLLERYANYVMRHICQ